MLTESSSNLISQIYNDFENAWRNGNRPDLQAIIKSVPPECQLQLLIELYHIDAPRRLKLGEKAKWNDYVEQFPELLKDVTEPVLAGNSAPVNKIDKYEIRRALDADKGGQGQVFLAYDPDLQIDVVIKLSHSTITEQQSQADLIIREAQTLARLEHPNLVSVLGAGIWQNRPYIISRYVEGASMRHLFQGESVGMDERLRLGLQVADTVAWLHEQNIVHHDLKPDNIMVQWDEKKERRIRLIDFGMARSTAFFRSREASPFGGTWDYMPPEIVAIMTGQRDSNSQVEFTELSGLLGDQFSLGGVLFFLVTGKNPYSRENEKDEQKQKRRQRGEYSSELLERADCPTAVKEAIRKSLQRSPSLRYTNAREFANALRTGIAPLKTSTADFHASRVTSGLIGIGSILVAICCVVFVILNTQATTSPDLPPDLQVLIQSPQDKTPISLLKQEVVCVGDDIDYKVINPPSSGSWIILHTDLKDGFAIHQSSGKPKPPRLFITGDKDTNFIVLLTAKTSRFPLNETQLREIWTSLPHKQPAQLPPGVCVSIGPENNKPYATEKQKGGSEPLVPEKTRERMRPTLILIDEWRSRLQKQGIIIASGYAFAQETAK